MVFNMKKPMTDSNCACYETASESQQFPMIMVDKQHPSLLPVYEEIGSMLGMSVLLACLPACLDITKLTPVPPNFKSYKNELLIERGNHLRPLKLHDKQIHRY